MQPRVGLQTNPSKSKHIALLFSNLANLVHIFGHQAFIRVISRFFFVFLIYNHNFSNKMFTAKLQISVSQSC